MLQISSTIKQLLIRIMFILILAIGLFFAAFFLVNLDIHPLSKEVSPVENVSPLDIASELKKRMGSTTFSVESYGDWAKRYNLPTKDMGLDSDPDHDGLPNYLEYVHGTNPLKADSDGDGYTDLQEINNGYDPDDLMDKSSRLATFVQIDKIGVYAPMVWSNSENETAMLNDLENGLSHFSKTSSPGQNGNMIISGHSSNYVWAKGDFNHIFKDLGNLEKGDTITVKTVQKNGRIVVYHYVVSDKFVTTPDDARVFAQTDDPTLTLSTCWPIGTNLKRLIIKTQLQK